MKYVELLLVADKAEVRTKQTTVMEVGGGRNRETNNTASTLRHERGCVI